MEDNNNDIYYSTHQVINDKINYLITLNDTLFINDIFYQFDNTDISFILYDYLFVLNNYIINHFHQYYNNLFNYLFYEITYNKSIFNDKHIEGNIIKECVDYIINCPIISNINPDITSYIDFFGNSNYIYNYCIPYVNIILNDFINSYETYYLYKDIFNYLLNVFETHIYQPIDYIYINIIKYEDIILNENKPKLINIYMFQSYLKLNINEDKCKYIIIYTNDIAEKGVEYNFYE